MSILTSRAAGLAWIERSHIRFRIAGGRHDGETCINLVVRDEIVRTATGDNSNTLRMETWDVMDLQRKTARLDITDRRKGSWGFVGHIDDNRYGSSADAAQWVAEHYDRLYRPTELFRRTYHDTTLPYWLANRITMPESTLACDNIKIHADGRMYCYEGVSFCSGTCGHVYNFVTAIAWLFPELERSVRLMQDFNEAFGFAPRITPDNFKCFFSGAEGWGTFSQKLSAAAQQETIDVKWGKTHTQNAEL